ncbi:MAG TPA: hypothetical protein ENN81_11450 [Phycisphaerales bacterium]|nr:hypothetical protein [Phycisphaerales bacterium]
MPRGVLIATLCLLTALMLLGGCESGSGARRPPQNVDPNSLLVYSGFLPVAVDILPLTELSAGEPQRPQLRVYVALLDTFGDQIKAPGVFRFELYEHLPRSADPKGARAKIWPDIELIGPDSNHSRWRDFLRAYEFVFTLEAGPRREYVLAVTFLAPGGQRLNAETLLFRP